MMAGADRASARHTIQDRGKWMAGPMSRTSSDNMMPTLRALRQDAAYGVRKYLRTPGLTLMIMLCIALGAGVNAALFSLVRAVLQRPLPFEDAAALVTASVYEDGRPRPFSMDEFARLARELRPGIELSARTYAPVSLAAIGDPAQMAQTELVSANYFDVLRQKTAFGVAFAGDPHAASQVVLSDRLWRRRFTADPAVLGRTLRLNGVPVQVIGIAPPSFNGALQLVATDLWMPIDMAPAVLKTEKSELFRDPWVGVIGRLTTNTTMPRLQALADLSASRVIEARTTSPQTRRVVFGSASGVGASPDVRTVIMSSVAVIWVLTGLLLVVAMANAAGLLLVAGLRREHELAVRLSLGATRWRLASQLLVESTLLVLVGTGVCLAFAAGAIALAGHFAALAPDSNSFVTDVRVDAWVLAFALTASAITVVGASLVPIRHVWKLPDSTALRSASTSAARSTRRMLYALASTQVAFTLVPIVTCGYVIVGLHKASTVDPGFGATNAVAFTLNLAQATLNGDAAAKLLTVLCAQMQSGQTHVAVTTRTPLSGRPPVSEVEARHGEAVLTLPSSVIPVSPNYFATLDVVVLAGREFLPGDGNSPVAIVSRRFAETIAQSAHHASLLGSRVRVAPAGEVLTVIGVADDVQYGSASDTPLPAVYTPIGLASVRTPIVVVRSDENKDAVIARFRKSLDVLAPDLVPTSTTVLGERLDRVTAARRRLGQLLGTAAMLGAVLSISGLGLVVAYGVQTRRREFAIRMALGAGPIDIARRVFRQALGPAAVGSLGGLLLTVGFMLVIRRVIVGIDAGEPIVLVVALVSIILIVVLGAAGPGWRAVRTEPWALLRTD
jgi:putative ABC transport system permease protein